MSELTPFQQHLLDVETRNQQREDAKKALQIERLSELPGKRIEVWKATAIARENRVYRAQGVLTVDLFSVPSEQSILKNSESPLPLDNASVSVTHKSDQP